MNRGASVQEAYPRILHAPHSGPILCLLIMHAPCTSQAHWQAKNRRLVAGTRPLMGNGLKSTVARMQTMIYLTTFRLVGVDVGIPHTPARIVRV